MSGLVITETRGDGDHLGLPVIDGDVCRLYDHSLHGDQVRLEEAGDGGGGDAEVGTTVISSQDVQGMDEALTADPQLVSPQDHHVSQHEFPLVAGVADAGRLESRSRVAEEGEVSFIPEPRVQADTRDQRFCDCRCPHEQLIFGWREDHVHRQTVHRNSVDLCDRDVGRIS